MAKNFWTNKSTSPKRNFRFVCSIGGVGTDNTWIIKTAAKPKVTITETPHQYLNHTYYYPGRLTWEPITITMVDPVNPSAAGLLAKMIKDSGYAIPSNETVTTSITKAEAVKAVDTITITQFDNDLNTPVETWTLQNAFITNCDWGELSYEDEGLTNLSVTVRYDYATVETNTGGNDATGTENGNGEGSFFGPTTSTTQS